MQPAADHVYMREAQRRVQELGVSGMSERTIQKAQLQLGQLLEGLALAEEQGLTAPEPATIYRPAVEESNAAG